ncbi:hypothetical protein MHLP_03500 [Candidatus Mycoplasma haematolamae str. Purdue]|uniref:Uncharacterized protein n=1 Tax=Mycoplasma haematolamae (strain Purdue) TaxID=1212765 RepID=I7BAF4_MYCHA|nr:hypothetical protein [Candidatus Mycoplasma haematolamae]AFO52280.1 hypothetical protein MHLP_03500 [Candidatus Mycoplasma haematolamae str. Purdue]
MIDNNKSIKEGMTLKLEKILKLQGKKDFNEAWSALPGIIDNMVKFEKTLIKTFQGYASKAGVKFAKEAWDNTWDVTDPVTPVGMIMRALRGNEFSKVCSSDFKSKHSNMTQFFSDECDKAISSHSDVKVVDVLKSAYNHSSSWFSSDWKVADRVSGGGWSDQPEVSDYSATSDLKNKGYKDGLVAEQCPQLGPSLTSILSVIGDTANKTVCEKILAGAFGPTVNEKRYWIYFVCCFRYLSDCH